ncbi:MAG: hypothetical protein IKG53_10050 [Solobacterium sp.]|nr:hypothetical protein [Solobacterium sp.]
MNFWEQLINDEATSKEDLFYRTRDLYGNLLKHLYNDPKNIPDFRIHFANDKRSEQEGIEKGYSISTVNYRSNKLLYSIVKDVSEIENFENSYTWFFEDVFVVFDFREDSVSPLLFITKAFWEDLYRQYDVFGVRKVRIAHMYETLIASGVSQYFHGFYQLDISLVQTMSALTYEGDYIDCSILVPRYDHVGDRRTRRNGGLDVAFKEPIPFAVSHLRQVRKLVEMSDKDVALVINQQGKICGLTGSRPNAYECFLRMWGHLSWTVTYNGNKKLSYYNARYHIHPQFSQGVQITKSFGKIGEMLDTEQSAKVEAVIRAAAKQRHGTIVIIGSKEDAAAETARLCDAKSATGISCINLSEKMNLIPYLTAIDGAVIMDTDCRCSCIGAILDGDFTAKGNPARGARFNSTVRYVRRRADLGRQFVGIVLSEDGTIDAVSDDRIERINLSD